MNEIKHTPGDWELEYCGKDRIKIFKTSDKRRIATIQVKSCQMDEANARLIASAPELLERLQDCVGVLQSFEDQLQGKSIAVTAVIEYSHAAIKKATGN